jgi:hypothetical protein
MRTLRAFLVAVLVTAGMVIVVAGAAPAEEVNANMAAWGESAPAYGLVGRSLPGARVESVLTDPSGAVAGQKHGTGWLLHYGTGSDSCARADATSGLRMMCVAW